VYRTRLNHSAAVRVGGQRQHVAVERLDDELNLRRRHALDALLHDVVAVLVADAPRDVALELGDERALRVLVDHFERLLNHATSVHLQRQRQDVALELARDGVDLLRGAVREELLHDVVPEHVRHERVRGGEDLVEHELRVLRSRRLELLLNEPRAVLVAGKLHDVLREVAELEPPRFVVLELLEQRAHLLHRASTAVTAVPVRTAAVLMHPVSAAARAAAAAAAAASSPAVPRAAAVSSVVRVPRAAHPAVPSGSHPLRVHHRRRGHRRGVRIAVLREPLIVRRGVHLIEVLHGSLHPLHLGPLVRPVRPRRRVHPVTAGMRASRRRRERRHPSRRHPRHPARGPLRLRLRVHHRRVHVLLRSEVGVELKGVSWS